MTIKKAGAEFRLKGAMDYLRSHRRQIAVFMVCVGISVFLWLMIKLNSHYIRSIGIQVNLTEVPENREAKALQSSQVIVEIRAQGYQLLFNEITMLKHLDLELSKTLLKPSRQKGVFFISTQSMIARIGSELPASTQILSMKPDTLFFRIDEIHREKVPVKALVSLNIPPPWHLTDTFSIDPDSVWIQGTRGAIKRISGIHTRPFSLSKPQTSFSYKLNLINPDPEHLTLLTKVVQLEGSMDKYTTQTWTLPIVFSDSVKSHGQPDYESVVVTCRIPEIKASQFNPKTLIVHGRRVLDEDGVFYVYPELSSPDFIHGARLTPARIALHPATP